MRKSIKWIAALVLVIAMALAGCAAPTFPPETAEPLEDDQYYLREEIADDAQIEAEPLESRLQPAISEDEIDDDIADEEPEDEPENDLLEEEETPPQPDPEPPQSELPAESQPQTEQPAQPTPQAAPQAQAVPQAAELTIEATSDNETAEEAPALAGTAAFAGEVIRLVNIERSAVGVGALTAHPLMGNAAQIRAQELPRLFSHDRPNGSEWHTVFGEVGLPFTVSGENVASGQATPTDVIRSWMGSTGHRNNILNGEFSYIGVGVHRGASGRLYWVQLFTASVG